MAGRIPVVRADPAQGQGTGENGDGLQMRSKGLLPALGVGGAVYLITGVVSMGTLAMVGIGAGVGYGVGTWLSDQYQKKKSEQEAREGRGRGHQQPMQLPEELQVSVMQWQTYLQQRAAGAEAQLQQPELEALFAEFAQVEPIHARRTFRLCRAWSAAIPPEAWLPRCEEAERPSASEPRGVGPGDSPAAPAASCRSSSRAVRAPAPALCGRPPPLPPPLAPQRATRSEPRPGCESARAELLTSPLPLPRGGRAACGAPWPVKEVSTYVHPRGALGAAQREAARRSALEASEHWPDLSLVS
ncbi:unnamed protein product [Prorocentrum cordatum]|uniref:Uncharacterized protein n=1 Tax=Prorocentrum cordatum TaxID=2364126 RepID=A0ABN9YCI7_9DINO|nr:unnamed protein product [Polarella glacialis]